jgi:CRISPR-associated protein Csb2
MRIADEKRLLSDLLSGHGAHPHCAIVPLPFVGHEHADGRLLGVGVLLPTNIQPQDRRRVLQVCGLLTNINLSDELTLWKVEVAGFDVGQDTLKRRTWAGPSRCWHSVTPILLDRFPKKGLPVESILISACERVGLPPPLEITHSPYSALAGVLPVPQFRLTRAKDERPRWGVHATLQFDIPVEGPLVLGAGRYFGLGLMKPDMKARNDS